MWKTELVENYIEEFKKLVNAHETKEDKEHREKIESICNEIFNKKITYRKVICENCYSDVATSLSYSTEDKKWRVCCNCTSEFENYYVLLQDFFNEYEFWIKHLSEKTNFDPKEFKDCLVGNFSDAKRK